MKNNLEKVKELRYYYHLTSLDWGNKVILHPRVKGYYRAEDEPSVSRICVSSEIEGCMVAIPCAQFRSINIYRTAIKTEAVRPYDVVDSNITSEFWILKSKTFIFIGSINKAIFAQSGKGEAARTPFGWNLRYPPLGSCLGDGSDESLKWQKKSKKIFSDRLQHQEYWHKKKIDCL